MHLAAVVTAAVDTAVTKQLEAVERRCMKMIKGHEKRVDARRVSRRSTSCPTCSEEPASRVIGECRSAPALLQSMDVYAGDLQLFVSWPQPAERRLKARLPVRAWKLELPSVYFARTLPRLV